MESKASLPSGPVPVIRAYWLNTEENFFVHRHHALFVLNKYREKVFDLLLPWLYDEKSTTSFASSVKKLLSSDFWCLPYWRGGHDHSEHGCDLLRSLPFASYGLGGLQYGRLATGDVRSSNEDPFEKHPDWMKITTADMIIAMRLLNALRAKLEDDQRGGPSGNPLTDELLDRPLPITFSICGTPGTTSFREFALEKDPQVLDDQYAGPLTLRKILAMLSGIAYVSSDGVELNARHVYVEDAERSAYFATHADELFERHPTSSWRVVFRKGSVFSPRVQSIEVMQNLYKRFEEASIKAATLGERGYV